MNPESAPAEAASADGCLAGAGELATLMRGFDWSKTPLGPQPVWPNSLQTALRILLGSRYAMWLGWGPQLTFLYNDAYRAMTLGDKHPGALGRPAMEVWPEIWPDIGPRIDLVMSTGCATWDEALLLFLERSGYREETYHTFSYSALADDGGRIAGMLCVVTEETERVLHERRLRCLRELAAELASATHEEAVLAAVCKVLAANGRDLPFTLTYLFDDDGRQARLACSTGIAAGHPAAPERIGTGGAATPWPAGAMRHGGARVVDDLGSLGPLPGGAWEQPPVRAALLPVRSRGQQEAAGFMVVGLNPYRPYLGPYQGFLDLLAGQVSASLANARACDDERRRTQALAELNRAKTAFFSNVSHEFRTPLTLALAPLDDLLARSGGTVRASRGEIEQVRRNMQRLLKLVNSLLDFSRVEAGGAQARDQPVALAEYTAELASVFRSAIERAGLRLVVDCSPLPEPVHVDPGMWEKIVVNLLSNALKFTFEGEIAVGLHRVAGSVELTVRDTGVGVPAHELPRLFQRFYRIEGVRSRTHEGSGIGLAVVHDLARLLGASVRVDSTEGWGSCFTVSLPLAPARVAEPGAGPVQAAPLLPLPTREAQAHLQEALGWLPRAEPEDPGPAGRPIILVADDNADMRAYLHRLLGAKYRVETVSDGAAALGAAREGAPDLVLADIMMPGLDGMALLRALRGDPRTRMVPVILLSARAGEANKVEGLEAGADDYLVKPFGAQELLARVAARLELARLHREALEREQALSASSEEAEGMKRLHEFSGRLLAIKGLRPLLEEVLDATMALHGADFGLVQQYDPASGDLLIVAQRNLPPAFLAHFARVRDDVSACGRAMRSRERVLIEDVTQDAQYQPHQAIAAAAGFRAVQSTPLISRKGDLLGVISTHFRQRHRLSDTLLRFTDLYARQAADIVERSRAEEALRVSEARFRRYFDLGLIGMALTSPATTCIEVNDELCRIFGYSRDELLHKSWPELTHPDDVRADVTQFERVLAGEQDGYVLDKRFIRKDGQVVFCTMAAKCLRAGDGSVECFVALVQDMSARVAADDALRRARDQLAHVARVAAMGELVASIAHEMNQPLAAIVANGHASSRWLAARPPNLGEATAAIDHVVADAHRASQVIARIRGFVRRSEAKHEAFDVHELLDDVSAMLEREARARNVKLQVSPRSGGSMLVVGDRVQLQQVLVNLVMNGFDAMATVPEAQRRLQLRVERDGPGTLRVSVRDAGVGVEPRARDRIFDAFFTSKPAGMGMGLAISRTIVEAHAGRLWSTPNEGGGETFSFTLPA